MNRIDRETPFRRNKFAGWCRYCKRRVGERQGSLVGQDDRGWIVAHHSCVPEDIWCAAADARQPGL